MKSTNCVLAARFYGLLMLAIVYLADMDAYAQNQPLTYIGIENGLSNNSVTSIWQDKKGFMWFGTYDGLNRYDGYQFKVYRNKLNDSNSLPHNYIYTIHEDTRGNLWIGTGQGIGIFNNLTSKFSPAWYTNFGKKTREKISLSVTSIHEDKRTNMFIGSNGRGLLIQDSGISTARQVPYYSGRDTLTEYNVQSLIINREGNVWLFIADVGLCSYNYYTNKIQLVNNTLKNIYCMEADGLGNLWIGSYAGLYKYSIAPNILLKAYDDAPGKLTANTIASLFLDEEKNLWIGTNGGGVNILNTVTGKFSYILAGTGKNALTSESVFAIYQDKEKRKWMGTIRGGINIVDPVRKPFQSFAHDPLNGNSLIYNFVSSFCEGSNYDLWIGTDGGGMSRWNRVKNRFTNFSYAPHKSNVLSNNQVTSICQDHTGDYWIATYGNGINRFNAASATFTHYQCINPVTGEENKRIWLAYEDREQNLWATTFGNGRIYRLNRKQNRFEMFDPYLNDLIALTEDAAGVIWAGNSHQLIALDKVHKQHKVYEIGKPVRAIYEDTRHNLWVGTEGGGLILFNRQSGKLSARFSDADGLCNNSVLNILEDNHYHLWLSTFNGLSRFDIAAKTFRNFYQSDGLQSNQFLYNSAARLHTGELVFGGIRGFTLFNPDSLWFSKYTPPVLITEMRVNNQPVTSESNYVVHTDENSIRELKIPYDEAVLSFDFAALEYTVPDKVSYAYYLEGWDKGWNYTGNVRKATYTRLKEGSFKLHVKSTIAAGEWKAAETTLKIIILPPWYRSWWAYLLYTSVAFFLVYLYLHYRTSQTRLEYEVKLAHLETEKEKELNEKKLSFFTDMSHEFRTPLTLIINPVKDLIRDGAKKKDSESLQTIYRNSRRLLSLIDQLLLFRKADTEGNKLHRSKVNYTVLCHEVYLCFVQEAHSRKMEYTFECPEELYLCADRQKIEIALYNLLSNAIKYTPSGGSISFRVFEDGSRINT